MRGILIICIFGLIAVGPLPAERARKGNKILPPMQLGVDADDWSGQIQNPAFEAGLKKMQIDFISWHIQPEEEADPRRLKEIAQFCDRNHWHYLFNNEIGNYRRDVKQLQHPDGTYRYDLSEATLKRFGHDPYFLGVVYDEGNLVQAGLGMPDGKGHTYKPYLANTRTDTPEQAFFRVSDAVAQVAGRYQSYGKRLIFEMTFPDYPFAYTRAGALVAPKLLKENFNDLMYDVYRGAALQYHSPELWTCIDLWFLNKFPMYGKMQPGGHTPEELLQTLEFANVAGFDYAYIEQVKGLLDEHYQLTAYGEKVVEFQKWRKSHPRGNWRTAPVDYIVKRFPDGYWGQAYSTFIPDHPYGSWLPNPYHALDREWFLTLNQLSKGVIPTDADTWNAQLSPGFKGRPYRTLANLPPMIVIDPYGPIPNRWKAKVIDLSPKKDRAKIPARPKP